MEIESYLIAIIIFIIILIFVGIMEQRKNKMLAKRKEEEGVRKIAECLAIGEGVEALKKELGIYEDN